MKIALDSGHGANTDGKRSFDGALREYEFNQAVTKRLDGHLKRHEIEVVLTSPNPSVDPILTERCRRANSADVDYFVSIHANAAGTDWNSAAGWEIYCLQKAGPEYKLAQCIHDESIPFLGVKDRGIKTNSFTVLTDTKKPAVLIEHGFYTNREECALLLTDDFREKCAIADAKGVLRYLGIAWKEETQPVIAPDYIDASDPNDIVWTLGELGVITDRAGFMAALEAEPNGGLYWLGRKTVSFIREKNLPVKVCAEQTLITNDAILWFLGEIGIVTDKAGFMAELQAEPNGRLYWTARKVAALLQSGM